MADLERHDTFLAEIRVAEPQNNVKNNSTNYTRGRMGQMIVIRCFVQNVNAPPARSKVPVICL